MNLTKLLRQCDQIEALLASGVPPEARNAAVSKWCIGEHLEHCFKANAHILNAATAAEPSAEPGISMIGRFVLLVGRIPRGKGQAPSMTIPVSATGEQLTAMLAEERERIHSLASRPELLSSRNRVMRHPVFGWLTAAQSLRFMEIHTRHHLQIIREIRASL